MKPKFNKSIQSQRHKDHSNESCKLPFYLYHQREQWRTMHRELLSYSNHSKKTPKAESEAFRSNVFYWRRREGFVGFQGKRLRNRSGQEIGVWKNGDGPPTGGWSRLSSPSSSASLCFPRLWSNRACWEGKDRLAGNLKHIWYVLSNVLLVGDINHGSLLCLLHTLLLFCQRVSF